MDSFRNRGGKRRGGKLLGKERRAEAMAMRVERKRPMATAKLSTLCLNQTLCSPHLSQWANTGQRTISKEECASGQQI